MTLFTDSFKVSVLDLITDSASRYMALFTTAPAAATGAGGVEATGAWYAREQLDAADWSDDPATPSGAFIRRSTEEVVFGPVASAAVEVAGWGIYDAATSGTLLAFGRVVGPAGEAAVSFAVGQSITFASGAIVIGVGGDVRNVTVNVPGEGIGVLTPVKTANYTAAVGERVRYDATSAPFTIFAPATAAPGDQWAILEVGNSGGSVTINGNGSNIQAPNTAVGASFAATQPLQSMVWEYDGAAWRLI